MITVYASTTDYTQLSAGSMVSTVESWMSKNFVDIDELVDIDGDEFVFNVMWEDGEGFDEYRVAV